MYILAGRADLRCAVLVVVEGAIRRSVLSDVSTTIPLVPPVTALCRAISIVVANARFMAPPLKLVAVLFLPEVRSYAPIAERNAVDGDGALGVNRTGDTPVAS